MFFFTLASQWESSGPRALCSLVKIFFLLFILLFNLSDFSHQLANNALSDRSKGTDILWCKSVSTLWLLKWRLKKPVLFWNKLNNTGFIVLPSLLRDFVVLCLYVCVWMLVYALHVKQRTLRGTWEPERSLPSMWVAKMRPTSVTMATVCLAGGCCGNGSIPGQRKWRYST